MEKIIEIILEDKQTVLEEDFSKTFSIYKFMALHYDTELFDLILKPNKH